MTDPYRTAGDIRAMASWLGDVPEARIMLTADEYVEYRKALAEFAAETLAHSPEVPKQYPIPDVAIEWNED
jgi:hypothetical protein